MRSPLMLVYGLTALLAGVASAGAQTAGAPYHVVNSPEWLRLSVVMAGLHPQLGHEPTACLPYYTEPMHRKGNWLVVHVPAGE